MWMNLQGKKIGFCLTGSFCTFNKAIPEMKRLIEMGADVYPIMSTYAYSWDTKFGLAQDWIRKIEEITQKKILNTVVDVEPIGPGPLQLDLVIVAPTTGNTLARLANGLTDGPTLMACKAQWRNGRPVVLAIATNDGLGANAKNIGIMHDKKLTFLVPYGQDNPAKKEKSLVAHFQYIPETIIAALSGKQFQPVLIPHLT